MEIDVAYTAKDTPLYRQGKKVVFDGPPILAVEVLSPSDQQADIEAKVDEYLTAKARELALKHAAKEWDQRAGIARQREENERGRQGLWRARMRLAKTMPLTVAGAATFLAYVKADMAIGEEEWHGIAIGTIVRSLKALSTQAVAATLPISA